MKLSCSGVQSPELISYNSPYPSPQWAIKGSNEAEGKKTELGNVIYKECEGRVRVCECNIQQDRSSRIVREERKRREREQFAIVNGWIDGRMINLPCSGDE